MRSVRPRPALFLFAALLAGSALAQPAATPPGGEPAFESISLRQGLTSSAIFALTVDRHGFVWLAGDNGLHRFDGRDVRTIDRQPGARDTLASRTNTALAETADALWILSFSGRLQRLDAGTGRIATITLQAPDGTLPGRGTQLLADAQGRLWIGTDIGLFRYDPASASHTLIALPSGAARITALTFDPSRNKVFVGVVDGRLLAVDAEPTANVPVAPLLVPASTQPPVPLAIAVRDGVLWVGTHQGLFRHDAAGARLDRQGIPEALQRWRLDAIAVARDGALWLGGASHLGLTRFDPERGESANYRHHPDDPHALGDERVSALAIDARDNLWIGLQRGGANRLRISQQGARRYRAGIGQGNSFCAVRQRPGAILDVSLCGGSIAELDPATGTLQPRGAALDAALQFPAPALTTHALVGDGRDGIFLPTANIGLLQWRPALERSVRYPLRRADGTPAPDPYMNDALLDRDGRLWVACSLGVAVLTPGADALTLLDPASEIGRRVSGGVLALAQAPDGALWLGSTQGLLRYDPATGATRRYANDPRDPRSLSDDLVVTLRFDRRGAFWVGTQAGLNRAEPRPDGHLDFTRYATAEGLPDQSIDALVEDAGGVLWVGTNRGIARHDAARDRFRAYGPGDGVPDSPVNWRAATRGDDGSLYFGTHAGLLRIFPERLSAAEPQPVMLGSYEVGGRERMHLDGSAVPRLETTYDQARVRFVLATFGDQRPLAYRMSGLEAQWHDLPASLSVTYDPLPAAEYRFQVRQLQRDGSWSAPLISVPLRVAPPPWRTPVAKAVYLGLGLLLAAALLQGWRRRRRQRERHLAELHHLANYDALTGLPNRSRFEQLLQAAMAEPGASLALFFIDLDRFKNINDSLGHRFGDRVLVAAGERLRAVLPQSAELARLGGDEFTVILPRLQHSREASTLAQALIEAFAEPLRIGTSEVVVTLSVGVALHPSDGDDASVLIQYADSAMYHAKSSGRNAYRFFQPEMVARVTRRLALETGLRSALEHDELHLVYQPQVALDDGRICGAEVLLRWDSAEHGVVTPTEFVPILEDTGLIEPVGLWVAERACVQLHAWRDSGLRLPCLAINVSVDQLIRGDLRDRLAQLMVQLQLPEAALELELTESTLMPNAQRMAVVLAELRALGLGLAIDDFGTGYSSFASLSFLPLGKLKIDKNFIDGLGQSERADTLCAAMVAMAHNLHLVAVAEGVETALQHERLRAMGCDQAQGYHYCRPLPREEFERFVREAEMRVVVE
jgi:diguanylate cyclase (GGDEF)-like protein